MNKQQVNPATWQDKFGFSQTWRVDNPSTVLFLSGQVAVDEEGQIVGEDVEEQTRQTFRNMGRVLEQAGMSFANLVQVGWYLTDISQIRACARVRDEFVNTAAPPASPGSPSPGCWSRSTRSRSPNSYAGVG